MKGYTVLYYTAEEVEEEKQSDGIEPITIEELLDILEVQPREVDAVIVKNNNGWRSPKLPMTLILRKDKGQVESVPKEGERGILTVESLMKGNVAKLLFGNKNFSPSIVRRIEKLLMPPEGSSIKSNKIFIPVKNGKFELNIKFIPNK